MTRTLCANNRLIISEGEKERSQQISRNADKSHSKREYLLRAKKRTSNKAVQAARERCGLSIIKARGEQAAANAETKDYVKFSDVLIKVPKGGSVRVKILGQYDYAEWDAHGLFQPKVITRPCIAAVGQKCPDCEVEAHLKANYEFESDERETFGQLRKQSRYLMAFGVMETGQIGVFDASKAQFNGLKGTIAKNAKADEDGEVAIQTYAFDFSRTTGDKTTYSLELVPKLTKKEQELFAKFADVKVEDDFYEKLLQARSREDMIADLKAAGADFGLFDGESGAPVDGVTPVDDGNDPTKGF